MNPTAIVIDKDDYIISGTSRHFAAAAAHRKYPDKHYDQIPAVLFDGTPLEGELLVIESNRQRVKLPSQLGREFNERFRIEQEFAKLRQQAGVPLKVAEGGDARDRAAKAINLGRTTAERLGTIVVKADTSTRAARLVTEMDEGRTSITGAWKSLQASKAGQTPADCPVCDKEFPSKTQLFKHGWHEPGMATTDMQAKMGYDKKDKRDNPPKREALGKHESIEGILSGLKRRLPDNNFIGYLNTCRTSKPTARETEAIDGFRKGLTKASALFLRYVEILNGTP